MRLSKEAKLTIKIAYEGTSKLNFYIGLMMGLFIKIVRH